MNKIYILILSLNISSFNFSQSLTPEVIASCGDYFSSTNYSVAWTLGEVVIDTYQSNSNYLTQGFHQPNPLGIIVIDSPIEFFNGFSPNGDGLNDYWNIPLLNKAPSNSVLIINRWGDEVWETSNYDNKTNNFKGDNMKSIPLPDGTYFYIIKYNNTEKRGWVFIKR